MSACFTGVHTPMRCVRTAAPTADWHRRSCPRPSATRLALCRTCVQGCLRLNDDMSTCPVWGPPPLPHWHCGAVVVFAHVDHHRCQGYRRNGFLCLGCVPSPQRAVPSRAHNWAADPNKQCKTTGLVSCSVQAWLLAEAQLQEARFAQQLQLHSKVPCAVAPCAACLRAGGCKPHALPALVTRALVPTLLF